MSLATEYPWRSVVLGVRIPGNKLFHRRMSRAELITPHYCTHTEFSGSSISNFKDLRYTSACTSELKKLCERQHNWLFDFKRTLWFTISNVANKEDFVSWVLDWAHAKIHFIREIEDSPSPNAQNRHHKFFPLGHADQLMLIIFLVFRSELDTKRRRHTRRNLWKYAFIP